MQKEIPFCDITFFHGEWQGSFDEPPTLLPFVLTKCYEHYSWLPAQPSSSRGWGTLLSQCFHRHLPTEEKLKSFIANFMENAVCVNQVFCVCFGGTGTKNIWLLCPNHSNLLKSVCSSSFWFTSPSSAPWRTSLSCPPSRSLTTLAIKTSFKCNKKLSLVIFKPSTSDPVHSRLRERCIDSFMQLLLFSKAD